MNANVANVDLKQRRLVNHDKNEEILIVDDEENREKIKRESTDKSKRAGEESPLSVTNIIWFLIAAFVFYYSNILNTILFEEKINRYKNSHFQ